MTRRNQSAFTLVELMLAMTFVSVLLLAIAMLTIRINGIYNKGVTLKAVNQSGQVIASDMQQTLNQSSSTSVAQVGDDTGGRLCANNVVYAWNYPAYYGNASRFNKYVDGTGKDEIRFIKFVGDGTYCPSSGTLPAVPDTEATDMLSASDRDLAVHKLDIVSNAVTGDTSQTIYEITLRLGTNTQEIITGGSCGGILSIKDDEYCAVNDLVFTARAGAKDEGGS
ncbi:MAG TPA: prepilin-type N-terminal cleavage/methylation domain-containing protein [Candidatus Saccharibacteria bacterium]|nr:prepilin-type N-terminal cleavage/methylation domain-containing protein [Candidatus Saccharibacteria bacterium]